MNRTIALLIPAILLVAMALIIFQQFHSSSDEDLIAQSISSSGQDASILPPGSASSEEATTKPAPKQPSNTTHEPIMEPQESIKPLDPIAAESKTTPPSSRERAKTTATSPTETSETTSQATAPKSEQQPKMKPEAKPEIKTETKAEIKAEEKPETKPESKPKQTQEATGTILEPAASHKMESMIFEYQDTDMLFILNADSEFKYKSFQLASPHRLVIDILGEWTGINLPNVPSNRLIKGIRSGKTERGRRIVLDLKQTPKGYDTKRDGNKVIVHIY